MTWLWWLLGGGAVWLVLLVADYFWRERQDDRLWAETVAEAVRHSVLWERPDGSTEWVYVAPADGPRWIVERRLR